MMGSKQRDLSGGIRAAGCEWRDRSGYVWAGSPALSILSTLCNVHCLHLTRCISRRETTARARAQNRALVRAMHCRSTDMISSN